jgi:cytochrome b561
MKCTLRLLQCAPLELTQPEQTMKQYSKRLAAIHWLTLILFIAALYLGHELDETEAVAAKMALYPYHFILGDLILILTLIRTYFLRKDGKPAPLQGGSPIANKVATGLHHLLYVLLIALPVSGMVMINTTGLVEAVKAHDISKMPDLEKFAIHEVHAAIVAIIVLTIALHALAALYHQFILKDNLLRRMALKRFKD